MTHTILAQILSMMTLIVAPEAEGAQHGRHARHADLCERLECTDDQRARIDAIRAEHRESSADERAEAKRLRAALKAERTKTSPNAEELARLQTALDAVKAELHREREAKHAKISAVLTPAQRERLDAMKAKHRAERGTKGKAKGDAKAKRERGAKGKAKGDAQAKRERGPKGKAKGDMQGNRERGPKGAALAG